MANPSDVLAKCVEIVTPENKRQAFERLAQKRTNAVLERIRVLSNCSNPYAYEYDDEDVRKIFGALERELRVARARFVNHRKREFTLSGDPNDR